MLCFAAASTVSTLATTTDPTKWEEAEGKFGELDWGELAVVENEDVAQKMFDFGTKLKTESPAALPAKDLVVPSIRIAHACRELIKDSWNVPLITLPKNLFE